MILGAHRSTAGGAWNAARSGREIGCDAVQIFTRAPQRWEARPLSDEEAARFREACQEYGVRSVAHDIYLTNLASADPAVRQKSLASFTDELARCEKMGIPYLVTHCGAHDGEVEPAIRRVGEAIRECLDRSGAASVTILLEGTAGQGNSLGSSFEELAQMLEAAALPGRTAVCLDTCHLFAAGYELRTPDGFAETFAAFDRIIGLDLLRCVHLNDAKKGLGSRVDRHASIGDGLLGEDAFRLLLNDPRFRDVPLILETPDPDRHGEEIELLRSLVGT
jgi:apurinic endonuclease (APN1)